MGEVQVRGRTIDTIGLNQIVGLAKTLVTLTEMRYVDGAEKAAALTLS